MVIFFNKQLIGDYGLEMPYNYVREGKWTIDRLEEMTLAATDDINGDSKLDNDDCWGLYCATNVPHSLWFGSGERIMAADGAGEWQLVMNNERSAAVIDKIFSFVTKPEVLDGNKVDFYKSKDMFNAGRLLFAGWALVDISFIREAEFDFGILPYPKYEETQSDYYNLISTILVPGVSVPITAQNTAMTGTILEALGYYSVDTLTVAYYDIALNNRYVRDADSSDMLDIIFATRVYDLGHIYDFGSLGSLIYTMYTKGENTFSSSYEKYAKGAQKNMEKVYEAFMAND